MNKKKILGILGLALTFGLALTSCTTKLNTNIIDNNETKEDDSGSSTTGTTDSTGTDSTTGSNTGSTDSTTVTPVVTDTTETVEDEVEEAPVVTDTASTLNVTVEANTTLGTGTYEVKDNIYTITSSGEFSFSGDLAEGSIVVNAEGAEVIINLNGVNITSTTTAPINIIAADKVEISAKSGTINYITDNRTTASDDDPTAAIYSTCDLKLKGKGELYVYGNLNNGIHSKDDLTIKNETIYVKALNNALKGNDSVEIENITGTIISTGGDGIKTTNSDISSKGNQRGTITITGGKLDIYACCDGIDAAYNVEIVADDEGNSPVLNIYTNSYSSYSNDSPTSISSSSTLYLQLSSSYYSSLYEYYAYCYDTSNKEEGDWISFEYYTAVSGGFGFNSSRYYYLKANVDSSKYTGIQIYMFEAGSTPSTSSYFAASTGQSINSTKDMIVVKSLSTSSKKIGVDWSSYSSSSSTQMGPGGMGGMMDQGNTDKTSYSTKGIKADNEVNISSGEIIIKSYDDGIHATSNVSLENGNSSTGNVNITGGNIAILSKDDGIHADNILTIADGSVSISQAYEGLEGNKIIINGGNINLYSTDDGINAQNSITVTGGKVVILVASGDTDAIDSNGTYTQSGGTVISINMSTSGTATALDTDGKVNITGGIFLGFGNLETTPTLSNVKSTTKSISLSSGTYDLSYNGEVFISFTLKTNYSKLYLAGPTGTYTIGSNTISL